MSPARRPRPTAGRGALGDPVVLALVAAVGLALVQAVALGPPGRILSAAVPYLLALLVVAGVRVAGPRRPADEDVWLRILAGGGLLLAVWLLGAFLGALPTGLGAPAGFYRVKLAVTSPVGDHNTAAGLLLPAVVAAAVLAAREVRWRAGLAVLALGLVATLSRGAVLVLLTVVVVGWACASSRRVAAWLLGAAAAATGGVLGFASLLDAAPPGQGALVEGSSRLGASVLGRLDLAERGLEVGLRHPGLGVGLGRFSEVAGDLPPPNDHAHQLLAHALAEGGVVLLAVAVLVPVVLLARAWRRPAGPLRDVTLLGGLALLAHAQVEILGGRAGYEVLVALLAGLAAAGGWRTLPT